MSDAQVLAQVDDGLEDLAAEVDSALEDLQIGKLNSTLFVHRSEDKARVGLDAVLVEGGSVGGTGKEEREDGGKRGKERRNERNMEKREERGRIGLREEGREGGLERGRKG